MSGIRTFPSLHILVTRRRDDLNNAHLVLRDADNRTGKTRLSMAFKDAGKRRNAGNPDTEDLFTWDNKGLFRRRLQDFTRKFHFALPEITGGQPIAAPASVPGTGAPQ